MTHKILNISVIGLMGVCLSACEEAVEAPQPQDYDPRQYITFGAPELDMDAVEGGFTRAELVDQINEFTVYGYCIPQDLTNNKNKAQASDKWDRKAAHFSVGPDVLDGFVVKYDGTNTFYHEGNKNGVNSIEQSQPKEWYGGNEHLNADDYNYAFIATSTPSGSFNMSYDSDITKAYPVLTFTMPWTSDKISELLDYTQQPDALIGTKFDQFNNSKVKLEFHHIMTGLRFRFHNQCSDKKLVIHEVTFQGKFYKEAKFIFDKESWRSEIVKDGEAPSTYQGTFVLLKKDQTIDPGKNDLMRHDGDPNGRSVKLLLLPNANATLDESSDKIDDWALGTEKLITIKYSIGDNEIRTWSTDKGFQLKYIPGVSTLHTANFHFVGDDFIVTIQSENDWANGSDNKLEIH